MLIFLGIKQQEAAAVAVFRDEEKGEIALDEKALCQRFAALKNVDSEGPELLKGLRALILDELEGTFGDPRQLNVKKLLSIIPKIEEPIYFDSNRLDRIEERGKGNVVAVFRLASPNYQCEERCNGGPVARLVHEVVYNEESLLGVIARVLTAGRKVWQYKAALCDIQVYKKSHGIGVEQNGIRLKDSEVTSES